jgi:hypothetical protein
VRRKQGLAAFEERAELRTLRERADTTGRDLSDTVAALAGKLAQEASPRAWARRRLAAARTRAVHRLALARRSGLPRAAAVAGAASGLMVIVAAAVLWQHRHRT